MNDQFIAMQQHEYAIRRYAEDIVPGDMIYARKELRFVISTCLKLDASLKFMIYSFIDSLGQVRTARHLARHRLTILVPAVDTTCPM